MGDLGGMGANLSVRHKNILCGKTFTKKMHEMKKGGPCHIICFCAELRGFALAQMQNAVVK